MSSDDDDDITPFVKRNSTARKQRIDSDDEGGDPPTLKQSLSLGSSDSTLGNLVPGPSTSALQRETDERIVPLELENISVGKSNLERIASDVTEGSQLQSDRPFGSLTPRGVRHEAAEICQTLAEKGEAVAQIDSGLGLSSQENPCSQLLVDVSSQEGPPHLQTISKEGSHLRGASDEGSDLNCLVAEDTLGAGDISSVDTSFSSFPPAQPRHSPNPKVSRTCRKDSTVSNQSDQVRAPVEMVERVMEGRGEGGRVMEGRWEEVMEGRWESDRGQVGGVDGGQVGGGDGGQVGE